MSTNEHGLPDSEHYRAGIPQDRDDMTGNPNSETALNHGVGALADRRDGQVNPNAEKEFKNDFFDKQADAQ